MWRRATTRINSDVTGVDCQCETSVLNELTAFKVRPCYALWVKAKAH